jgi:hypothetical protein
MRCTRYTQNDSLTVYTLRSRLARVFVPFVLVALSLSFAPPPVEQFPPRKRSAKELKQYEEKVDWFYKAKYGIMFHFVPNMHRFKTGRIEWTNEKWNAWVDAVDVDKVARQADEVGAGYMILSISQGGGYACAPNPVIERYWKLKPGESASKRDLPMDLYHALKKYDIPLMLYIATSAHHLPDQASEKAGWFGEGYKFTRCTPEGADHWAEALQWYSDHYGDKVSGWWLDGLTEKAPGYREKIHAAVIHGNSNALTTSATYALSDFDHGHCVSNWKVQQKNTPNNGRWVKDYNIQWHAFQYLGRSWAARGTPHSTESVVEYASNIIKGGGVITFDIGAFDEKPKIIGPYLTIPDDQMKQLHAVREAIK